MHTRTLVALELSAASSLRRMAVEAGASFRARCVHEARNRIAEARALRLRLRAGAVICR